MQTEYLKTLLVLGQTGSFSRSATELSITQSAVSQRIKFLEDNYGWQLVDRSGKNLVLTEAGRIVAQRAEEILLIEAKLLNDLKQQGEKSRLAICCTPTFGVAFLPRVMECFMPREAENVDLKFMFHSLDRAVKDLQENEYDLAVVEHCENLDLPGFEVVALPKDELVFVSSSSLDLPVELGLPLLFQQCLIARKQECTSRRLLDHNLARQGFKIEDFKRMVVVDDLRLSLDTVVGGGGIAFISRSLAVREIESGALREHFVAGFEQSRRRSAVLKSERANEPVISRFMECINATFPRGLAC